MEKSDMSQDGCPSVLTNNYVDDTATCNDTKKPNINIELEKPERNFTSSGVLENINVIDEHKATTLNIDEKTHADDGAPTLNIDEKTHAEDGATTLNIDEKTHAENEATTPHINGKMHVENGLLSRILDR